MKKFFKQFLLILILIIIIIFSVQNLGSVTIKFLNWSVNIPLFLALIGIYVLGTISGSLLISLFRNITKKESN